MAPQFEAITGELCNKWPILKEFVAGLPYRDACDVLRTELANIASKYVDAAEIEFLESSQGKISPTLICHAGGETRYFLLHDE